MTIGRFVDSRSNHPPRHFARSANARRRRRRPRRPLRGFHAGPIQHRPGVAWVVSSRRRNKPISGFADANSRSKRLRFRRPALENPRREIVEVNRPTASAQGTEPVQTRCLFGQCGRRAGDDGCPRTLARRLGRQSDERRDRGSSGVRVLPPDRTLEGLRRQESGCANGRLKHSLGPPAWPRSRRGSGYS
jgi:hypothetical protein